MHLFLPLIAVSSWLPLNASLLRCQLQHTLNCCNYATVCPKIQTVSESQETPRRVITVIVAGSPQIAGGPRTKKKKKGTTVFSLSLVFTLFNIKSD